MTMLSVSLKIGPAMSLKFSFSSENLEQESHVYYLHRPVNFFIRIFVPVSYLNYGIK